MSPSPWPSQLILYPTTKNKTAPISAHPRRKYAGVHVRLCIHTDVWWKRLSTLNRYTSTSCAALFRYAHCCRKGLKKPRFLGFFTVVQFDNGVFSLDQRFGFHAQLFTKEPAGEKGVSIPSLKPVWAVVPALKLCDYDQKV